MTRSSFLLGASAIAGCVIWIGAATACPTAHPDLSESANEVIFQQISTKTTWDLKAPLAWTYYFYDPDPKKLQALSQALQQTGYRQLELAPREGGKYLLHLERLEVLTAVTLAQRNNDLIALAERNCIAEYDGFDVGPKAAP